MSQEETTASAPMVKLQFCGSIWTHHGEKHEEQQCRYLTLRDNVQSAQFKKLPSHATVEKKMIEWGVPCTSLGREYPTLGVVLSEYDENAMVSAECPKAIFQQDKVASRTKTAILTEFPTAIFINYFIRATTVTKPFDPIFPRIKRKRILSMSPTGTTYIEEYADQ